MAMLLNDLFTSQLKGLVGYNISEFTYKEGETPMSTVPEVVTAIVGYFLVIYVLYVFMKDSEPFKLNFLFSVHNALLSFVSLVLLALLVDNLSPKLAQNGLFWGICSQEIFQDNRLEFYYYVNYIIKYVELLDTVFLVLKKKPLSFLHVYHHSLTAVLCFTQLNGNTSVVSFPFISALISLPFISHLTISFFFFFFSFSFFFFSNGFQSP